ncbi:MAG: GMC family oxidoreductase [bacterium]|nr:gluconate 5-dehydrogenase [Deltaproteobacteria bacterium]MCP4904825.1 GMC family oxidoreductase [bacterium]
MPSEPIHDVCVIGTGAGGGVWIDVCTRAGLDVVGLERGPELGPADFARHDELTNTHRHDGFAPDWRNTLRADSAEIATAHHSASLAQCVGGGTAHWGAVCWRMREDEFRVLSTEGPVEGASLADWPLAYEDLVPYYDRAEKRLGVAGLAGSNPFEPRRDQAYPNPAHPPRRATLALQQGAQKLGQHPFATPLAVNPRPYGGRGMCMYAGQCSTFGCPTHAKASTLSIHIPAARATGGLDLRTETRVVELVVGQDGRVEMARTIDAKGSEREVRARTFVLAAGSLGSPHLLLSSRSARFPNGLANGSGQVGRNLMFHILSYAGFELPEPSMGAFGPVGMVSVDDLHPSQASRGFLRGAIISEAPEPGPLWAAYKANEYLGREHGAWGKPLKDFMRRYPYLGCLISTGEDLPQHANRVDLDPDHVDDLGIALPRITHRSHPNDLALARYFEEAMKEIAMASGAVRAYGFDFSRAKGGSGHIMGTCRMGSDPATSVVDRDCRSHEVSNLYVSDGSCFPTSSGYNPTLTIFAIADRAVTRFLARRMRRETT